MALAVICCACLALEISHFWPFLADDAYISLRYSQRLISGHGLTWNDMHPPVEGYTNLLWVLLCAVLGAVGVNLETAAHLLGISSTVAGIAAVAAQVYRDYPAKLRFISALVACVALAFSAPIAAWALGGLEQPLLAALLAWAAYFGIRWVETPKASPRDPWIMGVLLGFALLTRADAAIFTAFFYAGAVLADGVRPRSLIARARLLPIPIFFFLGQELFRHAYYGEWVPNTAYVKVAFTLHRLRTGLKYDLVGIRGDFAFVVLAIIGAVALWIAGKRRQDIFIGSIAIGWLVYILVIGGDIFPAYRHFVPALEMLAFLIAGCGLLTLEAPFRFSRVRVGGLLALVLLVLTSNLSAEHETWEREGKAIGLFLHTAFGAKHPLLVSDAAGVVPFFADMDAIDPLGLNDHHIARQPTADRGLGWVGHELGDGAYVLDHKPDLLLLSNFQSAVLFPADQQLVHDPRFAPHYQLIHIDAGPPNPIRAGLYIRRIDGKLGIEQQGNEEIVPGYLADINDANAVRLIDHRAQLVIAANGSASFSAIPLAPGCWTASASGAGAAQVTIAADGPSGAADHCVESAPNGTTRVTVRNTASTPATLDHIELTRSGS